MSKVYISRGNYKFKNDTVAREMRIRVSESKDKLSKICKDEYIKEFQACNVNFMQEGGWGGDRDGTYYIATLVDTLNLNKEESRVYLWFCVSESDML